MKYLILVAGLLLSCSSFAIHEQININTTNYTVTKSGNLYLVLYPDGTIKKCLPLGKNSNLCQIIE